MSIAQHRYLSLLREVESLKASALRELVERRSQIKQEIAAIDMEFAEFVRQADEPRSRGHRRVSKNRPLAQPEPKSPAQKLQLPEAPEAASGDVLPAENERIDAQKIASQLGVPVKVLSEGLGLPYEVVQANPSAAALQKALLPVKTSLDFLHQAFRKPEIIRNWLNTPHPMLDGQTSLETILQGKAFALERILGDAWEGVIS